MADGITPPPWMPSIEQINREWDELMARIDRMHEILSQPAAGETIVIPRSTR